MITKDMSIMEIMQRVPQACEVLARYGMGCVACMGSATESLENGAMMHDIDLEQILKELNALKEK